MPGDLRSVAVYAPMKRGLKAFIIAADDLVYSGCSLCPDEKGTESRGRNVDKATESTIFGWYVRDIT